MCGLENAFMKYSKPKPCSDGKSAWWREMALPARCCQELVGLPVPTGKAPTRTVLPFGCSMGYVDVAYLNPLSP